MLGGALIELSSEPVTRIIDAAAAAAGGATPVRRFSVGSGGSLITEIQLPTGSAIMRTGLPGQPSDSSRSASALDWLAKAGVPLVPRPIGTGQIAVARWSLETRLAGTRAARLTDAMLAELTAFCARLPASFVPSSAFIDDLDDIGRAFPARAPVLKAIGAFIRPVLRTLPAVARHGDLWSGNVLVDDGRLAGVIDWDAWHPRGVPGTDLLHCLATDLAHASGRELGSVWLEAPWRSARYQRVMTPYWSALDVWPDAATLQAVGIAWWAGYVAHSLACDPQLVGDARWAAANVDAVLSALERVML